MTAFLAGVAAAGAVLAASALAIGVLAESNGWADLRVALGPVVLLAFEREHGGGAATFGPGLVVLALAAGAVNGLGAALLRRRLETLKAPIKTKH